MVLVDIDVMYCRHSLLLSTLNTSEERIHHKKVSYNNYFSQKVGKMRKEDIEKTLMKIAAIILVLKGPNESSEFYFRMVVDVVNPQHSPA